MSETKSNTQVKREWEHEVKVREKYHDENIRLQCLVAILTHGPEAYKKGDTIYRVANRMYSYIKNKGNPDVKYESFM